MKLRITVGVKIITFVCWNADNRGHFGSVRRRSFNDWWEQRWMTNYVIWLKYNVVAVALEKTEKSNGCGLSTV